MGYKVAVVGATGNVGREVLKTMAERNFPADEVVALASSRSVGTEISYGEDKTIKAQDLATFDFTGTDIVLSSPGAKSARNFPRRPLPPVLLSSTTHPSSAWTRMCRWWCRR